MLAAGLSLPDNVCGVVADCGYTSPREITRKCLPEYDMGNSLGGMESYIALIDRYEKYQGGFIWDYMDQALWHTDAMGRRVLGYGGDFNERTTDYNFSGNGIVYADGTEKPAMQEVRYWYDTPGRRAAHDARNKLAAERSAAALAAAQEVAHVLVTYNGQVCFTPYFASASTGTASAAEVWGNDRAWLQAVDSPYDQSVSSHWNTNGNSSGTARFSRQTLQDRIRDVMDIDLSGVDPNSWFTIQSANQYGWVAKIQVGPDAGVGTVSGRWFRENLLARQSVDGRSLRSQCFTVSYNADLDCFIFDVYGYGHGCGMSQWGAIGYARNGWGYQDILTHYFVGTTITTY